MRGQESTGRQILSFAGFAKKLGLKDSARCFGTACTRYYTREVSTVLILLPQGPEFDEEEESEFTVTELKERARKQREELERRMMGDGSDEDDDKEEEDGEQDGSKGQRKQSNEDSGCSWGMGEPL